MDNQINPQEKQPLEDKVKNILTDLIKDVKTSEREHFIGSLDPPLKEIREIMGNHEKRNAELKVNNLKNKIALIAFNGALIALMVSSAEKIYYGLMPFLVLFFSFSVGILELIIFYLMNVYQYVEGKLLGEKCEAVFEFCKKHKDDPSVIIDTQSFIHHAAFKEKKIYNNIPQLLKDVEHTHNAKKIFIKVLFFEVLFYIPLIIGFGQVIYKLFKYLPK